MSVRLRSVGDHGVDPSGRVELELTTSPPSSAPRCPPSHVTSCSSIYQTISLQSSPVPSNHEQMLAALNEELASAERSVPAPLPARPGFGATLEDAKTDASLSPVCLPRLKAQKAQLQRQGDSLARESKELKAKMLGLDNALKDFGKVRRSCRDVGHVRIISTDLSMSLGRVLGWSCDPEQDAGRAARLGPVIPSLIPSSAFGQILLGFIHSHQHHLSLITLPIRRTSVPQLILCCTLLKPLSPVCEELRPSHLFGASSISRLLVPPTTIPVDMPPFKLLLWILAGIGGAFVIKEVKDRREQSRAPWATEPSEATQDDEQDRDGDLEAGGGEHVGIFWDFGELASSDFSPLNSDVQLTGWMISLFRKLRPAEAHQR